MSEPDGRPGPEITKPAAVPRGPQPVEAGASGAGSDRPRRRGCLARLLRGCGIALLVIFALLLCGYFVEVYRCSRFTPTGDALFDRYARAVIRRQAWRLFHGGGGMHPATLPDELLAGWEDDFGDDPRYWQLRYWCAYFRFLRYQEPATWDAPACYENSSRAVTYLEQARDRDVVDADTLYFLLYELSGTSRTEEEEDPVAADILDQMIAEAADEAWPHFVRAWSRFKHNDIEGGLEDLTVGNASTRDYIPRCFPVSFVYDWLGEDRIPGNPELVGAVCEVQDMALLPVSLELVDLGRELLPAACKAGNRELLNEWHRSVCWLGMAGRGDTFDYFWAFRLIDQEVFFVLRNWGEEMTETQRDAVLRVQAKAKYLNAKLVAFTAINAQERALLWRAGVVSTGPDWEYSAVVTPLRTYPINKYANWFYAHHPARWRLWADLKRCELSQHSRWTRREFALMGAADFGSFELPSEWREVQANWQGFPERPQPVDEAMQD